MRKTWPEEAALLDSREILDGKPLSRSLVSCPATTNPLAVANPAPPEAQHPGDSKLVEKSCRLLKHSMRCAPGPEVRSVSFSGFLHVQETRLANDPEPLMALGDFNLVSFSYQSRSNLQGCVADEQVSETRHILSSYDAL